MLYTCEEHNGCVVIYILTQKHIEALECPFCELLKEIARLEQTISHLEKIKPTSLRDVNSYREGYLHALIDYAWWKDGEQRVGNGVKTLKQAKDDFVVTEAAHKLASIGFVAKEATEKITEAFKKTAENVRCTKENCIFWHERYTPELAVKCGQCIENSNRLPDQKAYNWFEKRILGGDTIRH